MKLKLWLMLTTAVLGGWAGFCATPDNFWLHGTSLRGCFDIGCGAAGGLFLGGMLVALLR